MRIAVVLRPRDPHSLAIYREKVCAELRGLGVALSHVGVDEVVDPQVDLCWDPGLGMRRVPEVIRTATVPVVVTVHGLLGFSLPFRERCGALTRWPQDALQRSRVRSGWRELAPRVARVIAVSEYGATEVRGVLGVAPERVVAIHHGVDHAVFAARSEPASQARPYFLLVAQSQPKKNVDRVLRAHAALDPASRPALIAVLPGDLPRKSVTPDVEIRTTSAAPDEIARLMQGAVALVMPSLHETFGMPILEAMASGCPVITSATTACPEVGGGAVLCVDPRDEAAIASAMSDVATDFELRAALRRRGIERAANFTWMTSAQRHLACFCAAAGRPQPFEVGA